MGAAVHLALQALILLAATLPVSAKEGSPQSQAQPEATVSASNGRLAAGPNSTEGQLEEDARTREVMVGVPWLDNALGPYFEWKSEYYEIPRSKLCPTPSACPPIIIGGHSKPAYRRAARYADGFSFISLSEEDLAERLAYINGLRVEYGRDKEPFYVLAGLATVQTRDDILRVEELGVTDLAVGYRNPYEPDKMTLQQKLDWVHRYGDDVISKL